MNSREYRKTLSARMTEARAANNPQVAADIICEAKNSSDQQAAMDAASTVGFRPEFYANSIRVWLDAPRPLVEVYEVRVRDVYAKCDVEEADVPTKKEADMWLKEWRGMYSREDGFRVTCKKVLR